MNKKGLSAVVASLLIVVVTIVAVIMVWQVVKGSIDENSQAASDQAACLNIGVTINSCEKGLVGALPTPGKAPNATITVQQGAVTSLNVSFADSTGSLIGNSANPMTLSPSAIGVSKLATASLATVSVVASKVYVLPIITGSSGNQVACARAAEELACI